MDVPGESMSVTKSSLFGMVAVAAVIAVGILLASRGAFFSPDVSEPAESVSLRGSRPEQGELLPATPIAVPERSEAPRGEEADALAITTAQPVMTLEGHLAQYFSQRTWDDPKRSADMSIGKRQDVRSIVGSREYNPDGKVLTESQVEHLMEIVQGLAANHREQMLAEGKLSKPAFVRAVERRQYEVIVRGRPEAMGSLSASMAQGTRDERLESVLDGLSARLGTRMEDWASSIVTTPHPDGVVRTIVVYITKYDEPQLFHVRDGLARHHREVYEAYKGFFAGL